MKKLMEQFKLTLLITKLFAPPWGSKTGYMSRNSTMCTTKIIHEQVISKKRRADCLLPHVIHHQPLLTTLSLLWNLVLDIAKPQILLHVNSQHCCQTHMYASSDFVIKPSHLHNFCVSQKTQKSTSVNYYHLFPSAHLLLLLTFLSSLRRLTYKTVCMHTYGRQAQLPSSPLQSSPLTKK